MNWELTRALVSTGFRIVTVFCVAIVCACSSAAAKNVRDEPAAVAPIKQVAAPAEPATGSTTAAATLAAAVPRLVRRKVLVLYDGTKYRDVVDLPAHALIEMPLNHLGLDVDYLDVNKGFPEPTSLRRDYRAVVSWFGAPIADPDAFIDFVDQASASGLRYILFGLPGGETSSTSLATLNRLYRRLGVRLEDGYVGEASGAKILQLDSRMIGHEQPLDPVLPGFSLISPLDDRLKACLTVEAGAIEGHRRSVLVATGPGGGFVQPGFEVKALQRGKKEIDRWLIDPFLFLQRALGLERFPAPDVTTVSGRRLYFSHVDGDGWNNISWIDGYRQKRARSSEVMLEEFIKPYPDLPVTVGLVTGDLDADLGGDPGGEPVAREIFALPQVEVGSHTHTHPFNWSYYRHYRRRNEERLIRLNGRAMEAPTSFAGRLARLAGYGDEKTPREKNRRYIAGGAREMPRAYLKRPFDLDDEIAGSLRRAESYAPPGKKARLMQWSGNTIPFEAAIRTARLAGVANINGGDSRFDVRYPSLRYIPPISRRVGRERQLYAVASNENTFTDEWTRNFGAQRYLTETLRNTEVPRRLKGFNLYYHTFSAERPGSLKAVRGLLDMARSGAYTPIPASHYADIAAGFFSARILATGSMSWRVLDRGALQTLRFDDADALDIDWSASRGVIGANRHAGSLYLSLDAATPMVEVALRARGEDETAPVHLVESRWRLRNLVRHPCGFGFDSEGFGAGEMVWRGLARGAYDVSVQRGRQMLHQQRVHVASAEPLALALPVDAREPVHVELACAEKSARLAPRAGEETGALQ